MKPVTFMNALCEAVRAPTFVKVTAFTILSLSIFFLFDRFSSTYPSLIFSSLSPVTRKAPSPHSTYPLPLATETPSLLSTPAPSPPSPPPKPARVDMMIRMGIVDETGAMSLDFEVGAIDDEISVTEEELRSMSGGREEEAAEKGGGGGSFKVEKYEVCEKSMSEYVPCMDNVDVNTNRRLKLSDSVEKYERHCPKERKGLGCLVPRPKGYQVRIPWPRSRDEAEYEI